MSDAVPGRAARSFVVVGSRAHAAPDFSLDDLPGTSGRVDVLVQVLRAALAVSHGVRRDTAAYLVLLGGEAAPRVVRVDGARVAFFRPDERALATTLRKVLAAAPGDPAFTEVRPGWSVADAGLDAAIADVSFATPYLLDEAGADARAAPLAPGPVALFLGDDRGLDDAARARLAAHGARAVRVSPVSLHAADAVVLAHAELDRGA